MASGRAPPRRRKVPIMTKPILEPKDQAEALALFRSEIVGALVRRELDHGDLKAAFQELSQQRFRPPRSRGGDGAARGAGR